MELSKKIEMIMSGLITIINESNLYFDYSLENKVKINKLLKNVHEPKQFLTQTTLKFIN
jgi:hypothetical protein